MIETVLFDVAEKQGIVAVLLVFLIIRNEIQQRKCLDRQHEVTETLLMMITDVLCDQNNSEQCQRVNQFKTELESKLARKSSRGLLNGTFNNK